MKENIIKHEQPERKEGKLEKYLIFDFYQKLQDAIASRQTANFASNTEVVEKLVGSKIVAKSVAIIASVIPGKLDIWLENMDYQHGGAYPHDVAEDNLKRLVSNYGFITEFELHKGYVLIDDKARTHLFFEDPESEEKDLDRKSKSSLIRKWEDLMRRYDLSTIMGDFPIPIPITFPDGWQTTGAQPGIILKNQYNFTAKEREDTFLRSFADKYHMNITQFLRFHLMARASMEAQVRQNKNPYKRDRFNYSFDLDKLAREIIAQNSQEGHL